MTDQDPWRFFFEPEVDNSGELTAAGQRLQETLSTLGLDCKHTHAMSPAHHSNAFIFGDTERVYQYHGGRVSRSEASTSSSDQRFGRPGIHAYVKEQTMERVHEAYTIDVRLKIADVNSTQVFANTRQSFDTDLVLTGLRRGKTKIEPSTGGISPCHWVRARNKRSFIKRALGASPASSASDREKILKISTLRDGIVKKGEWLTLFTEVPTDDATLCARASDLVSVLANAFAEPTEHVPDD